MPSFLHETLVFLFRQHPALTAELLRLTHSVEVPHYEHARLYTTDLSQLVPTEYRADVVVVLDQESKAKLVVIVEVQLSPDERKRYTWPLYQVAIRAKLECEAVLLVVTPSDATARWAEQPFRLGGTNTWAPAVLPLSSVPPLEDQLLIERFPALGVLSVMAHGRGDPDQAARVAQAALLGLERLTDDELRVLYSDLIDSHLGDAARKALAMIPQGYQFQSKFGNERFSEGKAEGIAEGKAEGIAEGERLLVTKMLTLKFGPLSAEWTARIASATGTELSLWAERLLTATSLDEVLRA